MALLRSVASGSPLQVTYPGSTVNFDSTGSVEQNTHRVHAARLVFAYRSERDDDQVWALGGSLRLFRSASAPGLIVTGLPALP